MTASKLMDNDFKCHSFTILWICFRMPEQICKMIRELANDYSISFYQFYHGLSIHTLGFNQKSFPKKRVKLMITTDHGTIRVKTLQVKLLEIEIPI
jgi:hypothetical protein